MPNLLVRNIDEGVVSALKMRAGKHGVNMGSVRRRNIALFWKVRC